MTKFRLIQRGTFKDEGNFLTGKDGIVNLSYMGSSEFENRAIPKSYRRLMYNFSNYEIFHTEIYTPEHDELIVFCDKNLAKDIIQSIQQFIKHPYHLKEFSELEKIPNSTNDQDSFHYRHTNFWWCIDSPGDWISFLNPQTELFLKAVNNDYNYWWLKKSRKQQKEEYQEALN